MIIEPEVADGDVIRRKVGDDKTVGQTIPLPDQKQDQESRTRRFRGEISQLG